MQLQNVEMVLNSSKQTIFLPTITKGGVVSLLLFLRVYLYSTVI